MHSEPFSAPKIEDFEDTPTFLLAYFQYRKCHRPQWSLHAWARTIGLRSGSLLSKVLRRERAMSDELFIRIAASFKPSDLEISHWVKIHLSEKANFLRSEILSQLRRRGAEKRPEITQ
jgi:hypothetical protein